MNNQEKLEGLQKLHDLFTEYNISIVQAFGYYGEQELYMKMGDDQVWSNYYSSSSVDDIDSNTIYKIINTLEKVNNNE